jgi:hypothetical protein
MVAYHHLNEGGEHVAETFPSVLPRSSHTVDIRLFREGVLVVVSPVVRCFIGMVTYPSSL